MLRLQHTFTGHSNSIYALAESAKPGIIFSAGNDKGVVEWSLKQQQFIMVKWPVNSSVYTLLSHENSLFAGEKSGRVTAFDFLAQNLAADFKAHDLPIFDIKILPGQQQLLTASEDGTLAIWSLKDFSAITRIQISAQTVRKIAVNKVGSEIALACKDGRIVVCDTANYSFKKTYDAHEPSVTAIAYDPTGKFLFSGGRDAQLKIWSTETFELIQQVPAHMFAIYKIAFHPTLPLVATCSQDKTIKIWDTKDLRLHKILSLERSGNGHRHSVNDLIWTHNGAQLISTGDDRTILVWAFE